jgi:hypothetical protein
MAVVESTSMVEVIAQFIAVCSSSILAETLGYAVSFASLWHGKRRVFERCKPLLKDQLQPSTNTDKLSEGDKRNDPRSRPHLSLAMDCPLSRSVEPPEVGEGIALPAVGSLHHHDGRYAACAYAGPLALNTFHDGFVRAPVFLREKLNKLRARRRELAFDAIAYCSHLPLAERTVSDPMLTVLNAADIGTPSTRHRCLSP